MNRYLIICDRLMYGSLLLMIFFLPYSLALIEIFQVTMMVAWFSKRFLLYKMPLLQDIRPPGINFVSSSMGRSLIAIALLIVLTIPFSHDPSLSIRKFFTRFLQQIFMMYLVTQIVHSRKRLYGALAVLLLTLCFVITDAMVQYTWGKSIVHHTPLIYGRVSGPMNHPNDLGTLLVTVLPVVLVLMITCRTWIPLLSGSLKPQGGRLPWVGMIVISVLFFLLLNALGLTASRGAWISFVVSIITLGVCLKRKKIMILITLILMVSFGILGMHFLRTRHDIYNARFFSSPSFTNPLGLSAGYNVLEVLKASTGRDVYWGTAIDVIKRYPFGCGYSAYGPTLRDMHVGHEEYPHNSLLQITAELGFLGLILYGWFFTALFLKIKNVVRMVSRERDLFLLGCGISSGILAWLIHSLLDTAWASLQLSVLWWLFIGILLSFGSILSDYKGEKS